MAAVEPELRELLCVLLDADLSFNLSSGKYPHFVGGAVAAMLQEVGWIESKSGGGGGGVIKL